MSEETTWTVSASAWTRIAGRASPPRGERCPYSRYSSRPRIFDGHLELREFRTQLGVPFLREDPIGVIALIRRAVRPFTGKQIELATTFADQAVIAIENVRLFEEVQARTAELQESLEYQTATSDVLNVISRSPSEIPPVLDAISETAAQLCDAYDTIIFLRGGRTAHRWLPTSDPFRSISAACRSGAARCQGAPSFERQPVHVHDVLARAEEFPEGTAMGSRMGYRTILAMPLVREDVAQWARL